MRGMNRKKYVGHVSRSALLMSAVLITHLGTAAAQSNAPNASYPNKPVRIIVAFAAGGPTDGIARVLAQDMSVMLNQTVIVENRTGANGQIGTVAAARATPDGHTLIYNSLNHTINSLLMKSPGYDPIKDFTPIVLMQFSPSVLVVGATQPWQSVQDLVQAAKSTSITFGSAGVGGSAHLTAELFRNGIELAVALCHRSLHFKTTPQSKRM